MNTQPSGPFKAVLHVWGITTPRKYEALSSLCLWQADKAGELRKLDMGPHVERICSPGGYVIRSTEQTLPPKNLVDTVRRAGLNIAWITRQNDPRAFSSLVFHHASNLEISFRASANLKSCEKVKGSDPKGEKTRIAAALLRLVPHFSTLHPANAHQRLVQAGKAPDIHIAHSTTEVVILEAMAQRGEERLIQRRARSRRDQVTR